MQGAAGHPGRIAALLEPMEGDLTILKPLHSAFHSTPLAHLPRQLKARELIVAGLATDMCVHLTAMDAYMRGYRLWVPRDCTAAESDAARDAALRQMAYFKCSVVRKSA
ncbi:isochorismatase family cysteine hydrolase [Ottowia sp.]|uniref:cysteine hydrolase family protein n=1 Tax=Ottowia sp. TaxID=1898956 RepID=UPI0025CD4C5E|nr:isochorismatase family cysteine hydrolase [Ottowia sp.]